MERAGRLNSSHGGGSMTFLGIADTLQGDLTGYIPSNLISMCDGQICLSTSLFGEGMRPAIDFGLSMSNVGGKSQLPILRELGNTLRLDYLQYVELQRLSKLQSGMSKEAEKILKKGKAIVSILQQSPCRPATLTEEVLLLFALREEMLTDLSPDEINKFKDTIYNFVKQADPSLTETLEREKALTSEIVQRLRELLSTYFAAFASPGT
jgi:F-type H+/Na+-transporting ATPase subunit alpha